MKNILLILVTASFLVSCNNTDNSLYFTHGEAENGKYSNDFFGLEFDYPNSWQISPLEELMKFSDVKISADSEPGIVLPDQVAMASLFTAYEFDKFDDYDFNSNIVVMVENLDFLYEIKDACSYQEETRKMLKEAQYQLDNMDNFSSEQKLGGADFCVMNANTDFMGNKIRQKYYTTIRDNFAINFIVTFSTEEQETVVMNFINSIQFN